MASRPKVPPPPPYSPIWLPPTEGGGWFLTFVVKDPPGASCQYQRTGPFFVCFDTLLRFFSLKGCFELVVGGGVTTVFRPRSQPTEFPAVQLFPPISAPSPPAVPIQRPNPRVPDQSGMRLGIGQGLEVFPWSSTYENVLKIKCNKLLDKMQENKAPTKICRKKMTFKIKSDK